MAATARTRAPGGLGHAVWVRVLLILSALALSWPAFAHTPAPATAGFEGASLFSGRAPIPARMRGHTQDLPPAAARCSNCHRDQTAVPATRSSPSVPRGATADAATRSQASGTFAPLLDRQRLLAEQSRRGGPASRFDALSFCRLLREGLDPALVMVDASMPRYQISDAQCSALWSHLTRS